MQNIKISSHIIILHSQFIIIKFLIILNFLKLIISFLESLLQ